MTQVSRIEDGVDSKEYNGMRRGYSIQERRAKQLHKDAGVPEKMCGIKEIKMFEKYLGKPTQIIGSQVLWGNFPFIMLSPNFKKNKSDGESWSSDPLRANKRAKVPYEISQGLKIAIIEQRTLWEWV